MMETVSNIEMVAEEDGMQDRRRANLKKWIDEKFDGMPARASQKAGKSDSLLRDVLSRRKSFGEKLARDLEQSLNCGEGYFDRPTHVPHAARTNLPQGPPSWLAGFEDLDDDQKQRIEDTVRGMILAFNSHKTKQHRKKA